MNKRFYEIRIICRGSRSRNRTREALEALMLSFLNPSIDQEDYYYFETEEGFLIHYDIDLNPENLKHVAIHEKDLKNHLKVIKAIPKTKVILKIENG